MLAPPAKEGKQDLLSGATGVERRQRPLARQGRGRGERAYLSASPSGSGSARTGASSSAAPWISSRPRAWCEPSRPTAGLALSLPAAGVFLIRTLGRTVGVVRGGRGNGWGPWRFSGYDPEVLIIHNYVLARWLVALPECQRLPGVPNVGGVRCLAVGTGSGSWDLEYVFPDWPSRFTFILLFGGVLE